MEAVNESGGANFPVHEDSFRQKMCTFHQTEVDFYEHVAKTLDIPVPRVFKTLPWKIGESEGLIQMEDMTGKGLPVKVGECLTIPQIKEIVRSLAHMHRRVLTSEDREFNLWKSKHNANQLAFMSMMSVVNDPTSFLEVCEDKGEVYCSTKNTISNFFIVFNYAHITNYYTEVFLFQNILNLF